MKKKKKKRKKSESRQRRKPLFHVENIERHNKMIKSNREFVNRNRVDGYAPSIKRGLGRLGKHGGGKRGVEEDFRCSGP